MKSVPILILIIIHVLIALIVISYIIESVLKSLNVLKGQYYNINYI